MPAPLLAAAFAASALLLAAPALAHGPHDHEHGSHDHEHGEAVVLFDGSSTDAWEKYNGGKLGDAWVVEDGVLHFRGAGHGSRGDIQTKETFGDFDLRFEFKVAEGSNSGVMYGVVPRKGAPAYKTGPEYQVLDDAVHRDGKNPKTSAGAFYALYAAKPIKPCPQDPSIVCPHVSKTLKPVGEWNTGRVVKTGTRVRHYLNGEKVVDVRLDSPEFKAAVADSKFADWKDFAQPLLKGEKTRFVLQDHNDPVWYRNITVREPTLSEDDPLLEG
jgi:hypothetical protein